MSEYGNGISMTTAFQLDKERIKHALKGQLVCGEAEDGFIYAPANETACEEYIISAFDNAVHAALEANDAACALNALIDSPVNIQEYRKALDKVKQDHKDQGISYHYDSDDYL